MSLARAIMLAGLACALFGSVLLVQRGTTEIVSKSAETPRRR